jgi:hypothetical protein
MFFQSQSLSRFVPYLTITSSLLLLNVAGVDGTSLFTSFLLFLLSLALFSLDDDDEEDVFETLFDFDKVCQFTSDRSVVFSGYSGFLHQ